MILEKRRIWHIMAPFVCAGDPGVIASIGVLLNEAGELALLLSDAHLCLQERYCYKIVIDWMNGAHGSPNYRCCVRIVALKVLSLGSYACSPSSHLEECFDHSFAY